MEQTVYADILFLINFSMDYLCFYITAALLHRVLPKLRALLSSIMGGVYSVAILFSGFVPLLELVCDIAVGLIMCVAVFTDKKRHFGSFTVASLTYIGVSVALGGFMTAFFNMINLLDLPLGSISESGDGMPVWLFALIAATSGAATLASGRFFRAKQSQRTANIEITYAQKTVNLAAICDSGNLLKEPISGKCVIVADISKLRPVLPEEIIRAVQKNDSSAISELPPESAKRIRLVPSRTATGSGILYALTPERLTVKDSSGDKREVDALFAPVILGNSAGGFQALIPPELMV